MPLRKPTKKKKESALMTQAKDNARHQLKGLCAQANPDIGMIVHYALVAGIAHPKCRDSSSVEMDCGRIHLEEFEGRWLGDVSAAIEYIQSQLGGK